MLFRSVHRQMPARFAAATELGRETARRVLERLAGLGLERRVPWSTELDIAVYNPSPTPRTDVVQVALDGFPMLRMSAAGPDVHPLSLGAGLVTGYTADGEPARPGSAMTCVSAAKASISPWTSASSWLALHWMRSTPA